MNVQWFRIRSWHVVRPGTRFGLFSGRAYCGRVVRGEPVDDRGQGPTCESCYRIGGPR